MYMCKYGGKLVEFYICWTENIVIEYILYISFCEVIYKINKILINIKLLAYILYLYYIQFSFGI